MTPLLHDCNSDDKECVPNIREGDEAKYAVADTLMGMGQGLKKGDISMEEEGEEEFEE